MSISNNVILGVICYFYYADNSHTTKFSGSAAGIAVGIVAGLVLIIIIIITII